MEYTRARRFLNKLAWVSWWDSSSHDGWLQQRESLEWAQDTGALDCESVGWIVAVEQTAITLTSTRTADDSIHAAVWKIPLCAVRQVMEIV